MIRRDFLKSSALVAATAALYSPLSASEDTAERKIIAIVSESAHDTGYISALEKGDKADEVIILGSDHLSTMHTLVSALENHQGSLLCGLLTPSDHAILTHVAASQGKRFVSEAAHIPSAEGVNHTENTFAMMSVKKAFDQFASLNTDQYGIALSSFHTIGAHNSVSTEKQSNFASDHTAKKAFVSFVLKA